TRSLLGAFLFRGDDVDKKVGVLSGGEKSRVALAKMIATPANLLILDEPTNHLDIQSQEVLQEAMRQYDGSIIVVSHNRFFANSFVSKVLEIKGGHGTIFDGNIDYYLHKTHLEGAISPQKKVTAPKTQPGSPPPEKQGKKGKDSRKLQADLRQQKTREIAPLKKIVAQSEQEIEQLEGRKTQLEQAMADPELYKDQDRFSELSNEYSGLGRKLKKIYGDWEQAQASMEEIEARYVDEGEE
ncbi:MAG: ATP-binding cassette domain-containing protein, partial [Proteobacteria bacterium]|nr:ATP-binding cassette domain-containing protein [Pseudomonadota bacterium]